MFIYEAKIEAENEILKRINTHKATINCKSDDNKTLLMCASKTAI